MILDTAWDAVFNVVTCVFMAGFGAWVWTLKPSSRLSRLLGLFAFSYGLRYGAQNLFSLPSTAAAFGAAEIGYYIFIAVCGSVAAVSLLAMAGTLFADTGVTTRTRGILLGIVLATTTFLTIVHFWFFDDLLRALGILGATADLLAFVSIHLFIVSFGLLPVAIAWLQRNANPNGASASARPFVLVGLALALWPAMYGGHALMSYVMERRPVFLPTASMMMASTFVLAGLWLYTSRLGSPVARPARLAAWTVLAVALFGALDRAFLDPLLGYSSADGPFWGLTRITAVVLLTYAILRHQALGIDVKLRWTISKGTVAGIILAAIFIASEGAQAWFGDDQQWLGLLVGGSVVFAISPLQRMADRLADKAVPLHDAKPATKAPQSMELYRELAKRLAADGALSPDDRRTLAYLAEEMRLGAGQMHDVLDEIDAKP